MHDVFGKPNPESFAVGKRAMAVVLGAAVLATLLACDNDRAAKPSQEPDDRRADPWFEETAEAAGVDFVHDSGHLTEYYMPEIMSGGVAMLDYDGDGALDLYFIQGGSLNTGPANGKANRLYRNRGDGTFEDVTEAAGVGDLGYGMGVACGDYDADGDVDLYVTNVGPNVLFRNDGDGTFTDVSAQAGVNDTGWGASCAFLDFDGDGDLDLFVVNYLTWSRDREIDCYSIGGARNRDYCSPNNYRAPAPDVLYRNDDNGRFVDVSEASGLGAAFGNGLGIACADFDADGDTDVYVANDGTPNQLWINTGNGRFQDQALIRGCAVNRHGFAEAGMGVIAVDIEADGDLDLFMSHLANESNTCYLNNGGLFDDATAALGLSAPSWNYTGFGLGFFDFDHDGHLDLFLANGRVKMRRHRLDPHDPYAEPDLLFRGLPGGGFEEATPPGGTTRSLLGTGRAAAFGDIDNDGDIDIVQFNKDNRAYVLRNTAGNRGHWIMFHVLGRQGSLAVGATLRIRAAGKTYRRLVDPAYGYCTSNDPRIHCGLGSAAKVESVTVRWPTGTEESFGPFESGKVYVLREADR